MPRLTVIATFHNLRWLAPQTLRSLQRNADPEIEFLLLDDASDDGTAEELQHRAPAVPGARVISNTANLGISATRNVGLAQARGEYLTFLDGDDFVAPGYYRELLGYIEHLGVDFLRTDHIRVNGQRRTVARIAHGPRGVADDPRNGILPVDRATAVDTPQPWTGIYHRRLHDELDLMRFREDLRTCEDRVQTWNLHLGARSFAVVGLTGIYWRRGRIGSLTQISDDRQLDFIPAFEAILARVRADDQGPAFLPKALRSYLAIMAFHLRKDPGELAEATVGQLRRRCRDSLLGVPERELQPVLAALDPTRRKAIAKLIGRGR